MTSLEYSDLYKASNNKEAILNARKEIEVISFLPFIPQLSNQWKVFHENRPPVDGIYLTARIRLGGSISTMLNEYKDGNWTGRCLDGGYTIAYQEITKEEFKELCGEYQNQENL